VGLTAKVWSSRKRRGKKTCGKIERGERPKKKGLEGKINSKNILEENRLIKQLLRKIGKRWVGVFWSKTGKKKTTGKGEKTPWAGVGEIGAQNRLAIGR